MRADHSQPINILRIETICVIRAARQAAFEFIVPTFVLTFSDQPILSNF